MALYIRITTLLTNTSKKHLSLKYVPPLYLTPAKEKIFIGLFTLVSILIKVLLILNKEVIYGDGHEYIAFASEVSIHLQSADFPALFKTPVFAHWGAALWGSIPIIVQNHFPTHLSAEQSFAIFFTLPSSVNIILVYILAKQLTCPPKAALLSALLFGLSFSNTYLIRHGLPADLSLFFALISLVFSTNKKQPSLRYIFLAGSSAFVAFFTYYGNWAIVLVCAFISIFYQTTNNKRLTQRIITASAGFFIPLIIFFIIGWIYGEDYFSHFFKISRSIDGGEYQEGYLIPFLFFYDTEKFLAIIWVTCIGIYIYNAYNSKVTPTIWIIFSIFFIYLASTLMANGFEIFAVYGRTIKSLTPFLCIVSALIIKDLKPYWLACFILLIGVRYGQNFYILYDTYFENEFSEKLAHEKNQNPSNQLIIKADLCNLPGCPDYTHCSRILLTHSPKQNHFYQYDELGSPLTRKIMRKHYTGLAILSCPTEK